MKKFVVSVIAILLTNNREAKYGEVVDEALLNNASKLEKEGFIKTEEDFNADKKVSEKSIKVNREEKDKAIIPAVDSVKSQNAIVDAEKNIDAVKLYGNKTTVQTVSTVSEEDAKVNELKVAIAVEKAETNNVIDKEVNSDIKDAVAAHTSTEAKPAAVEAAKPAPAVDSKSAAKKELEAKMLAKK